MREANFAPVYCSLYPEFAEIARKHGYALAIHGSLAKDMDLVAIPWTDSASEPQAIVDAIVSEFSITQANGWTTREHGRQVTTLVIAFGDCFVDLSFVPRGDSLSRSPAMAVQPTRAWETDDGRVISAEQKQQALRDGGASASSVRPFSIALGRIGAAPAMAAEAVGEAGAMPGTDGFTMAAFRAADVPIGTKLYAAPQPAQASYDGNHVENHCPECSQYESECECAQADARVGLTATQLATIRIGLAARTTR